MFFKITFKNIIFILLFFVSSQLHAKEFTILTNSKIKPYTDLADSFNELITNKGHQAQIIDINTNDNIEIPDSFIFTIGKTASYLALEAGHPFFFTMITRPENWNFIDANGTPQGNYTGLLLSANPEKYLSLLLKSSKKILHAVMFYKEGESSYAASLYESAAKKYGIDLILKKVSQSAEVIPLLYKIKKDINIIISHPDPVAYSMTNIKQLLQFSVRNKIPFVGFSKFHSKAGAVLSIYPDESSVTDTSFRVFNTLITNQTPLNSLKIYLVKKNHFAVNKNSLKLFKNFFNTDLINDAKEEY